MNREERIWKIIESDLPDDAGISAEDYYCVGIEYETGLSVPSLDIDLAIKCYEKAASMGYTMAMLGLARVYQNLQKPELAYKWLLEAAHDEINRTALYRLGIACFDGDIVVQDLKKAFHYISMAHEKGEELANYYLGYYAENGLFMAVDLEKALTYYRAGAVNYDFRCMDRLKELEIKF